MKVKHALSIFVIGIMLITMAVLSADVSFAYPPAVGVTGNSPNCLSCHVENGPWEDDDMAAVDILDKATGKSLRQGDGSFMLSAHRNEPKTIMVVLGRRAGDTEEPPTRNGWIFVDHQASTMTKFPEGWQANVQFGCRVVGDTMTGFEGARVTIAPMTLVAGEDARDAELTLHAMISKGTGVKGKAKEGLISNFLDRKLKLKIIE